MRQLKAVEKENGLTLTYELLRSDCIKELQLRQISSNTQQMLLPMQYKKALFSGRKFIYQAGKYDNLWALFQRDINFGTFLEIIQSVIQSLKQCEQLGIFAENLELRPGCVFYDKVHASIRFIYWPLQSNVEYISQSVFFLTLGDSYVCKKGEESFLADYMTYISGMPSFSLSVFEQCISALQAKLEKKSKESDPGQYKQTQPLKKYFRDVPVDSTISLLAPYLLRNATQTRIKVKKFPFVIGRQRKMCDYVVDSISVSRTHVTFRRNANGKVTVTDNHSLNGTKVDGATIAPDQEVELHGGAVISIGTENFTLLC